jgi:hypothetical protein
LNPTTPDSGSITPYGTALLAFLLALIFGLSASTHAAVHAARLQNLADASVLYAHDRAESLPELKIALERFLELSEAENLTYQATRTETVSEVRVCAEWQHPFAAAIAREICRGAAAKSFELER